MNKNIIFLLGLWSLIVVEVNSVWGQSTDTKSPASSSKVDPSWPKIELDQLKQNGVFGFPASQAKTLCDSSQLRLQAYNDRQTLIVQAILWNDGDHALGETRDGREIGDNSNLILDLDYDQQKTSQRDRNYSLNPWPSIPGLRYSILYQRGSSHIKGDSTGRGSIRYFTLADGSKSVRVDTYAIPLSELQAKPNTKIGLAYLGESTRPEFTINSIDFQSQRKRYYQFDLPFAKFHQFELLAGRDSVDLLQIPAGREDTPAPAAPIPQPTIGSVPPEFHAAAWLNTDSTPSLKSMHGKVVLIDFWATWCGPCVAGIPHLNQLQADHAADGLQVLAFTDQSRQGIQNFQKKTKMNYPVAVSSRSHLEYGVIGFPTAFIIGRDGKVLWRGDPTSQRQKLDDNIIKALAEPRPTAD